MVLLFLRNLRTSDLSQIITRELRLFILFFFFNYIEIRRNEALLSWCIIYLFIFFVTLKKLVLKLKKNTSYKIFLIFMGFHLCFVTFFLWVSFFMFFFLSNGSLCILFNDHKLTNFPKISTYQYLLLNLWFKRCDHLNCMHLARYRVD